MANEIMVNGMTTTLANKELAKRVQALEKLRIAGVASTWAQAQNYKEIVDGDLFEDDFDSLKNFAEFMGITTGAMSQKINGLNICEAYFNGDKHGKEVGFFYEMRVFVGEKATLSLEDFQSYLASEGVDLWAIGTSALKKYIKAYKDDKAKEIPTGTSEEISSEKAEPETDKEPVYVDFEINGKKYHIPEEVLAEYEVK